MLSTKKLKLFEGDCYVCRKYEDAYFNEVIGLERKIYPPEIALGPDIMGEKRKAKNNYSMVVFHHGRIVVKSAVAEEEITQIASRVKASRETAA